MLGVWGLGCVCIMCVGEGEVSLSLGLSFIKHATVWIVCFGSDSFPINSLGLYMFQVCAIITWLLLLYAEYVVMVVMLMPQFFSPYNFFNAIVYNFFAFLALSSHLRAMLSDPVSFNWFKLKVTNVFLWLNLLLLFF